MKHNPFTLEFQDDAKLFFISDTHIDLDHQRWLPQIKALREIISEKQPAALFILGDFIDGWIGAKHTNAKNLGCLKKILEEMSNICKIYFMPGNRDCLINAADCKLLCMSLIPDPTVIKHQNCNIALTHGDLWCTDDIQHLKFRKLLAHPLTTQALSLTPTVVVKMLRNLTKKLSRKHKAKQKHFQPNWRSLQTQFAEITIDQIIHGHTHQFENTAARINLGFWPEDHSAIYYYSRKSNTHHLQNVLQ